MTKNERQQRKQIVAIRKKLAQLKKNYKDIDKQERINQFNIIIIDLQTLVEEVRTNDKTQENE